MKAIENTIQLKMRKLVEHSCNFDIHPTKEFQQLHTSLLKFYFKAVDVNIDYQEKLISIWNSKPLTTNPLRLFNLNEAVADWVGYTDLQETLDGCIEEGPLQTNYYKKLLFKYAEYLPSQDDAMSA